MNVLQSNTDPRMLVWDEWNKKHIERHGVFPYEVEAVCKGISLWLEAKKNRLMVIGRTQADRILAVILDETADSGFYYVVTARPADKKERNQYSEWIKKESSYDEN